MGTKKAYDLAVAVGSYTDHSGVQKHRYLNVGVVLEKDDGGKFILLERSFNPSGVPYDPERGNTILLSMFEPKKDGQSSTSGSRSAEAPAQKPAGAKAETDGFTDDIPF
jgi:hypothetical protein